MARSLAFPAVDLLILGSGPAGCAAAISARQAGLSVLLGEAPNRARPQPGETLHPGVEPIFRQLGVWEAIAAQSFHRHRGIWREEPAQPRRFEPYGRDRTGPWLGLQVNRQILHGILRARAVEVGAVLVPIPSPRRVLREAGRVTGVQTGGEQYHAKFVIDATGRRAWLAEQLRLSPERPLPSQTLRFGWARENVLADLDGQPLFRRRSDGWDWLAPLGNGQGAWVKLRRGPGARGLDYSWRLFPACAGPGYFLTGDAASLIDPSAANGVLRALLSGIHAAHLAASTLTARISEEAAYRQHRTWTCEMFARTREAMMNQGSLG